MNYLKTLALVTAPTAFVFGVVALIVWWPPLGIVFFLLVMAAVLKD